MRAGRSRDDQLYLSRSDDSFFTHDFLCVRSTPTERRIFTVGEYKVRGAGGQSFTRPVKTKDELRALLTGDFGIRLPHDFPLCDPAPRSWV